MTIQKFCPLYSFQPCIETHCGFYDTGEEQCSVLQLPIISSYLAEISESTETVTKKLKDIDSTLYAAL